MQDILTTIAAALEVITALYIAGAFAGFVANRRLSDHPQTLTTGPIALDIPLATDHPDDRVSVEAVNAARVMLANLPAKLTLVA